MDTNPAEAHVELEGINYYTLLEEPSHGAPNAPCILLIHALMSNLHMWDATVQQLHATGHRTLRYDHVGHHNTPPAHDPTVTYHLDDLTRHAHQLVKSRTGQAHAKAVIGCSIGGSMAFRYASLFPDDVDGIISIASPGIKSPASAQELWTQRIEQFEKDVKTGDDVLCHQTIARWFPGSRPEDDGVRAEALQHVKTCDLRGYSVLADAIRGYDYTSHMSEIGDRVKTLVVAGEEDQAGRADVLRDVAGGIPGAEFVVLGRTGHLPPMQRAGEFWGVMGGFLRSLG
ncbi:hypothetical protein B0A55_09323 [Friedmanniomyces simplex]|uniref:AB hydrolase-1 domain-containing protein n=1 Tax=Friedmanniomyces simplex TaxID=329884 RepID=A0A4U0WVN5_9PEZI|nr:hypothetical protein B0A55_09323 [Friedmanniomyces simplex]